MNHARALYANVQSTEQRENKTYINQVTSNKWKQTE